MKSYHYPFLFIGALLSLLVPCPARFGYVLLVVMAADLLMILGTGMRIAVDSLHLNELGSIMMLVFLVFTTILIKQFIILYSPVIAMTLSFVLYLVPVSAIIIGRTVASEQMQWKAYCISNLQVLGVFTGTCLVFGFVRELIAYESISLPAHSGLWIIPLNMHGLIKATAFWGSIPGAFILLSLILAFMSLVQRRFNIIRSKD